MKPSLLVSSLALAALVLACSSKSGSGSIPPGEQPPTGTEPEVDPDDPANQPPHALGTIVLGESHVASTGKSTPIVTATFVPDAAAARACATKIEGTCEIVPAPKCTAKADSPTGCGTSEYCTYDKGCTPTCKKVATCAKTCAKDEVCTAGASGEGTCVKTPRFDAGPLAFSGTTTAVTLYPPYAYEGKADGAPFLPGSELRVKAQGAAEAGFAAFDETFTSTTFVQTSPALDKLASSEVFGKGPLTLGWVPGADEIRITVSGTGGTVTCKAVDAEGTFAVPRVAIDKALGSAKPEGTGATMLSVSVARRKKEVKKGLATKGSLPEIEIQPEAWVELVTTSVESVSVQGCATGLTSCGGSCVDTKKDDANCGACGKSCGGERTCAQGACVTAEQACQACLDGVQAAGGACKAQSDVCRANAACSAYVTCIGNCTTDTCVTGCATKNPGFEGTFGPFQQCVAAECEGLCR
jgi:hypothetical protein